jgi:hypothetical protein
MLRIQVRQSMSEKVDIETFIDDVKEKVVEGMAYRDAMQLCAVMTGGKLPSYVSQADGKYLEATFEQTELSKQPNVDECALASMGKLWHGENFEGSTDHIDSSDEEIVLDSLYFILKYAESETPLESALEANENVCGDKAARKAIIERMFDV